MDKNASVSFTNKPRKVFSNLLRGHQIALLLVLALAVAIRITYLIQYQANVPYSSTPLVDSFYYDSWAMRVVEGKGYGSTPFYMAPLYPYFLAILYKVAGHQLLWVYIVQMILGVLNILLTYLIGRKLFGYTVGLISAVLVLFYAPLFYLESKILTETLSVTLNLASLLLMIYALNKRSLHLSLVSGIVLGLSVLCRPVMLLYVGLVFLWFLSTIKHNRGITGRIFVPVLIGVVISILPVTVRNYVAAHDFVPISTSGGIVFAQGNNKAADGLFSDIPGFSGVIMEQEAEARTAAEKALGHPVKASELSNYWLGVGLRSIREQPVHSLVTEVKKVLWSLHTREMPCNYNIYLEGTLVPLLRFLFIPFPLLAGLSLVGFYHDRRQKSPSGNGVTLLGLYVISVFLSLLVFFVTSRFRAPVVPGLAIFAAVGLVHLYDSARIKQTKALSAALLCVAAVACISLIPYPVPKVTSSAVNGLGASYLAAGKIDKAIIQFEKALEINPNLALAHKNFADALIEKNDYQGAIEHYTAVVTSQPDNADAHNSLGALIASTGDIQQAMYHFSEAVRLNPELASARNNLAKGYAASGDVKKAIELYRETLSYDTENTEALNNLAWVYATNNNPQLRNGREAVKLAEKACTKTAYKNPELLDTLAAAYAEAGRFSEAVKTAEKALSLQTTSKQSETTDKIRSRIKLYQSQLPLRSAP